MTDFTAWNIYTSSSLVWWILTLIREWWNYYITLSLFTTSYQVTEWLTNSSTHQPTNSLINQPTKHTTHQSTEQQNNQTTNAPINQLQGVVPKLIKKFPIFYETWGCITMFTRASHLFLSSATIIKSIPSHPSSSKHILISSCHLCPCT